MPRVDVAPTIDGRLDDTAWTHALKLRLAYETRPAENAPASVETEAFLAYDKRAFYVAFRAHDPHPERIRAHLIDRDQPFNDDLVGMTLDTYDRRRRAYQFYVNPLGVQIDRFRDELSQSADVNFNVIWQSAGRITRRGYIVEIAIPFSSLRFPGGKGPQTWRIDLARKYPRNYDHRLGLVPLARGNNCYLCQLTEVRGFDGLTSGHDLQIAPSLTLRRTDLAPESEPGNLDDGSLDVSPGLDVEWGVTPSMTLTGTINPDFSQVPADQAQVDVNNQFSLSYPEQRPFFLEGADLFHSRMEAVHTRTIVDPDWGLKLTGKHGADALGAFAVEDASTAILFPGVESSDLEQFDFSNRSAVLRYRRDLGESSSAGLIYTSRAGGEYMNRVFGGDGVVRFTDADTLQAQWLGSQTQYPDALVAEFDQPAGEFSGRAFDLHYNHDQRDHFLYSDYRDVGMNFRADLGFVPQIGYNRFVAGGGYRWYGSGEDWYRRLRLKGEWVISHAADGSLR
ncbi:MAG: DUF5916 domain-containing protein, partial [Gammaproteobacteria bacterium]